MKKKKFVCVCITVTLVLAIVVTFLGEKMIKHHVARRLCDQIQRGETIDTSFSNGTSYPVFLNGIATVFQMESPRIPLVEACYYRNVQAVEVLLKNGADPNFFIKGSWSPLEAVIVHGAIDENSLTIIRLLVEHGADVNAHASETPPVFLLSAKMVNGSSSPFVEDALMILLEHHANIDDGSENSVFHHVVRGGKFEIAEWLLEKRSVDINCRSFKEYTPLISVIIYSPESIRMENVKWLLSHRADITLQDQDGKTAYDHAIEKGYDEIAELLKMD